MSQTIATYIITSFFSFTGILWGFILAAICVEELTEFYQQIQKVKFILLLLTTAILFYITTRTFNQSMILALLILISGVSTLILGQKNQNNKQEYLVSIPIVIAYVLVIIKQVSFNLFLILASANTLYFFLIGISLHSQFLGTDKITKK